MCRVRHFNTFTGSDGGTESRKTSGSGDSTYVEGINNIYEFDFGDLSGWMYFVNGESPSVSCGEYVLSDTDEIKWLYTCDIGKDLESNNTAD